MPTLKEDKMRGLVETEIGLEQRDIERALAGISKFIERSITELDLNRIADEANLYDDYYLQ